jgi:hypothetical protein
LKAQHADGVPTFVLKNVEGFEVMRSKGVPDTVLKSVAEKMF